MRDKIKKRLFNGIIYVHILHHGAEGPFYGSWMIEELRGHGYILSPGTLYPVLKEMVEGGLLDKEEQVINGKVRKYYRTTEEGKSVLDELLQGMEELLENK